MLTEAKRRNPFKPRWSKVASDLGDSKSRTILVIASIAVGVFAIGMIVTAYAILSEDIDRSYASVQPANIEIWTDPFDEDLVRILERIPGVKHAEGRHIAHVRGRKADGVWLSLKLIAAPDFAQLDINQLSVIDGTSSPGRREMLISKNFMNNTGYQVGDDILIEFPDGSTRRLPVVGLVTDQAGGGDPSEGANTYLTTETLRSMGLEDTFNRLYLTVEQGDDEDAIAEIADRVEDRVERNQLEVYRTEIAVSNEHPMATTILAILGVLGALGILVMVLSSTLIINTLNALLTQQMRQIGVMKLIGGRSLQILGMYLILITAYGLVALLIAVPIGTIAGYAFASFIAFMTGAELQGFRFISIAVALQALTAFLIPLGAGFFPVKKGSETNVRRAISNDRPGAQSAGLGWMTQISRWIRWVSRPITLSIRNTFRQRGRLVLTIFTLTVAGAVFIGVFNVRESMGHFMDQLTQHFMGDVALNFNQPYPITRIEQAVLPLEGVDSLEAWGGASAEIWDADENVIEHLRIIAPPVNTALLNPDLVAGRWLEPGERKAVVVSDTIYEIYPDLRPGDTIRVKFPGQREQEWSVVGVFRFISMLGDTIAYADFDFVADLLDLPNQAYSYKVTIEHHTLDDQIAVSQVLDDYFSDREFKVGSIEAGLTTQEDASEGINILVIFLMIMALLIALVGSIGLTGTMGMNVLERTREIGVMRAIGAVDLQIVKSVVIEGLMIGLITWVLAIGLSFPISYLLLRIIGEAMMGSLIDLYFTAQGMIIWLMVVAVLSAVASLFPARKAARLTIREVLAYE